MRARSYVTLLLALMTLSWTQVTSASERKCDVFQTSPFDEVFTTVEQVRAASKSVSERGHSIRQELERAPFFQSLPVTIREKIIVDLTKKRSVPARETIRHVLSKTPVTLDYLEERFHPDREVVIEVDGYTAADITEDTCTVLVFVGQFYDYKPGLGRVLRIGEEDLKINIEKVEYRVPFHRLSEAVYLQHSPGLQLAYQKLDPAVAQGEMLKILSKQRPEFKRTKHRLTVVYFKKLAH